MLEEFLHKFVHDRLDAMRARPMMYASTQESFGMQLLLMAEIAMRDQPPVSGGISRTAELMRLIFGPGNAVHHKALEDEWAVRAVDATKRYLEK